MKIFSFYIVTYGCKVNQYESQALREAWQSMGGREFPAALFEFALRRDGRNAGPGTDAAFDASGSKEASAIPVPCASDTENGSSASGPCSAASVSFPDYIILAGCAVTAEGVTDARQMARRAHRAFPEAKIIVTGCAASAAPEDFMLPGVTAVVPQTAKWNLLECAPWDLPRELPKKEREYAPFRIRHFERTRPVLKVQDGCSHRCSYCIVPLTRGPARSRAPEESIAEARRLLEAGYREIMISGVNLRQYYAEKENFWAFLRRLHREVAPEWGEAARFRLSSLEPAQLDSEGLETLEECSMLCPHLHLSLQSGSPMVLRRMGREHYTPRSVLEAVRFLRRFWPVFGLGADILMGFPGETEEETEETLAVVRELPLTYAHVFPYSMRPGTAAASLGGHLPRSVRQEHAARVRALVAEKKEIFARSMLDLPSFRVSLDQNGEKNCGWNEFYVPCILDNAPEGFELLRVRPLAEHAGRVETGLVTA